MADLEKIDRDRKQVDASAPGTAGFWSNVGNMFQSGIDHVMPGSQTAPDGSWQNVGLGALGLLGTGAAALYGGPVAGQAAKWAIGHGINRVSH